MQNIKGFDTNQTLEFLRAYMNAPMDLLTWERYPICTFIMIRYIERRHKIMLHDENMELKKAIWQFVAHWYDVLGYGLPIDACAATKLFETHADEPLWRKVEARREFIDKVINQISTPVLVESYGRGKK